MLLENTAFQPMIMEKERYVMMINAHTQIVKGEHTDWHIAK